MTLTETGQAASVRTEYESYLAKSMSNSGSSRPCSNLSTNKYHSTTNMKKKCQGVELHRHWHMCCTCLDQTHYADNGSQSTLITKKLCTQLQTLKWLLLF